MPQYFLALYFFLLFKSARTDHVKFWMLTSKPRPLRILQQPLCILNHFLFEDFIFRVFFQ